MRKTLVVIALCLPLCAIGCGEKEKTAAEPEQVLVKPTPKTPAEASPSNKGTNHATASFLGRTLSDMKVTSAVKLSKYTMFTLNKGRINVMLAVPQFVKGSYEASVPGQGVALTLTGAGERGKVSIRAMRSAKIDIHKDGDVIEGSYSGRVAGAGEEPIEINGDFRFERKMIP